VTSPISAGRELARLRRDARRVEKILQWKRKRARFRSAFTIFGAASLAGWLAWTAWHWGDHVPLVRGSWICAPFLGISALGLLIMLIQHGLMKNAVDTPISMFHPVALPERYTQSMAVTESELEELQEEIRLLAAELSPPLQERRNLYREEIPGVIEQYRKESRGYRNVHNWLQSLVMMGSAGVTTLAAMEATEWTWQKTSAVGLAFCVTVATAFTGYYKYRERSYFLQQTADAIEEEANALTLKVVP
jgi:Protein of unknown function (DUF4231)